MRLIDHRLTRFQFARDRVIGDSQVRADDVNVVAVELIADTGDDRPRLHADAVLSAAIASRDRARLSHGGLARSRRPARRQAWRIASAARAAATSVHRRCPSAKPFRWRSGTLPQSRPACRCGSCSAVRATRVRAYASGLDFHLDDDEFARLFRPCGFARLLRLQDQGRASGLRMGPASPRTAEAGMCARARW